MKESRAWDEEQPCNEKLGFEHRSAEGAREITGRACFDHRPGTAPEECESCTSSTTGRGTDRERCKEGASVGGAGRRSARSAQPGNPREPGFYWRSLEAPGQVNANHCVFNLIFEK